MRRSPLGRAWDRLRAAGWLGKPTNEADALPDPAVANSRDTGGPDPEGGGGAADADTTTGTGESEKFVGRTAGVDLGYAGDTGAEQRAEAEEGDERGR